MLLVLFCLDIFHLYLFHLIVLLNPVFKCSKSLLSYRVDKITTAHRYTQFCVCYFKCWFVGALIVSIEGPALGLACRVVWSVNTQLLDQFKVKDTSQLINGIYNALKRLFKCFNRTEKLTSLVFPVILALYFKFVIGWNKISLV